MDLYLPSDVEASAICNIIPSSADQDRLGEFFWFFSPLDARRKENQIIINNFELLVTSSGGSNIFVSIYVLAAVNVSGFLGNLLGNFLDTGIITNNQIEGNPSGAPTVTQASFNSPTHVDFLGGKGSLADITNTEIPSAVRTTIEMPVPFKYRWTVDDPTFNQYPVIVMSLGPKTSGPVEFIVSAEALMRFREINT